MNVKILRKWVFSMEICADKNLTEKEIINFAEKNNAIFSDNHWNVVKDDEYRSQCEDKEDCVHITLSY